MAKTVVSAQPLGALHPLQDHELQVG